MTHSQQPEVDLSRRGAQIARLEALFEAVPLALAIFDAEQRLTGANARYRDLTGLAPDVAAQRSIYDSFPNALADLAEQVDTVLDGVPVVAARVPFQHKGGRRLIEVTFAPLGEDAGIVFAGIDVTEREELREDLARSVAQLESIFDVIPDAVRVVDADGRTLRANTQAQHLYPDREPTTLREMWQLDHPRLVDDDTSLFMHEHPTARALRGERVRGVTLAVNRGRESEEMIVEVNSNPLYDEHRKIRGAVTVERDVTQKTQLARALEEEAKRTAILYERVSTEAERLERMVQERTQELLALQDARARERRLAAVGQLAAGVMHDVNNALNPIMAAAYLLVANANNPDKVRDYADRIAKAAETGAATAQRVGRFIRQEPLQGEREELVDLSVITDEVIAMTRPLWTERADGTVELERNVMQGAVVSGIPGELREALLNLVQNALDAMKKVSDKRLGVHTRVHRGDVVLEIRDSGSGMSAEVRERAFEPFFTTKGNKGTGLGLAEVYGIVRRHRGHAEIESMPGAGTTIRVVLPLATPTLADEDAAPERKRVSRHVLLVEDHVDSREFMQALLESDSHTVRTAGSIEEAMRELESGSFEVLVTDLGLPDGSGWDLIRTVRERWPSIRVGVVTGWEPQASEGVDADFILRKPVRTSDFLAQVSAS